MIRKNLITIVVLLCACSIRCSSQIQGTIKVRATGFSPKFGDTYSLVGFDFGISIRDQERRSFGGFQLTTFTLNDIADYEKLIYGSTPLDGSGMMISANYGYQWDLLRVIHPYVSVSGGFQYFQFYYQVNSGSFTTCVRPGIQFGKRWRFDLFSEFGMNSQIRYINEESLQLRAQLGGDLKRYIKKSAPTFFSIGAGLVYVLPIRISNVRFGRRNTDLPWPHK